MDKVGLVIARDPRPDPAYPPVEIAFASDLVAQTQRVISECGTDFNGHPLPRDVAYVLGRHGIGERRGEAVRRLIALQRSEAERLRPKS